MVEHKDFREVLENNNQRHEVVIGYNKNNDVRVIDLKENPSVIVTGETGSGKSILLDQIVCQLIKNNTSLDMDFFLIDSSGVELNLYADSRYSKDYALRDNDKALSVLVKVLNIMDERYRLIHSKGYITVDEYNEKEEEKLSDIVLVIDDNDTFIMNEDISKQITSLITGCKDTNIFFIGAFSNTDNYFFKSDKNTYSSIIISFDMSDAEHANYANVPGAEDLPIGKFIISEDNEDKEYYNFDFDDKIIVETLNK